MSACSAQICRRGQLAKSQRHTQLCQGNSLPYGDEVHLTREASIHTPAGMHAQAMLCCPKTSDGGRGWSDTVQSVCVVAVRT